MQIKVAIQNLGFSPLISELVKSNLSLSLLCWGLKPEKRFRYESPQGTLGKTTEVSVEGKKKRNHFPTEREATARPNVPAPTAASVRSTAAVPQSALPQDGTQRLSSSPRRRRGPNAIVTPSLPPSASPEAASARRWPGESGLQPRLMVPSSLQAGR